MTTMSSTGDVVGVDARGDRLAAACGIVFTVLTVAAAAVAPPAPETTAGVAAIRGYLVGHERGLSAGTALTGLSAMVVIGFFAFVHGRLRAGAGPLRTAFLVAGAVVTAATIMGVMLEASLVQQLAPTADDSTLGAFYALWDRVFHTAPTMGMSVALVCAAVLTLRTAAFARWLTAVALLAAGLMLIDIVEDLATTGTNLGPLGLVAFGLANVWILGLSITGLTRPATLVG